MITRDDLTNWETNDYLDKVILHSVAILNSLTLNEIKELDTIMKKYSVEILSEISYFKTYIGFVMDNFATIQQDVYLPEIINDMSNVRNITYDALSIANYQILISKVAASTTFTKDKIEKAYDLPVDSLSIYTDANIEQGINFVEAKSNSPVSLKYYEGKVFLRRLVSIFEDFSATKNYYDDADFSGQYSFVDKFGSILDGHANLMQNKVLLNSTIEEIIDSCLVTLITYEEYGFTSKESIDLFLNRKYSKIKEDVVTALKNHL